jgi:hypothetical protein
VLARIGALPKKCTIHNTSFSHNGYMKSLGNFMKTKLICSVWKKQLFDNIVLTQNHAWHITQSGWNNFLVLYKQQLRNNTILSRALFIRNAQFVMLRFMVQALQDPLLCCSTNKNMLTSGRGRWHLGSWSSVQKQGQVQRLEKSENWTSSSWRQIFCRLEKLQGLEENLIYDSLRWQQVNPIPD